MRPARPVIDRLLGRVVIDVNDCWNYPTLNENGYGVIGLGGRGGRTSRTHRVTYEHFAGPIPEDMDVDHLCRNRACCNPNHLEAVTRQVNLLRGERKTKQTECRNGHPLATRGQRRVCVACERAAGIRYRARKKATA